MEWTDRVTAFNGGSALLWGGISLTGNTRLVITAGDLSSQRYLDEILQRLGLYALQSGGSSEATSVRGVERMKRPFKGK